VIRDRGVRIGVWARYYKRSHLDIVHHTIDSGDVGCGSGGGGSNLTQKYGFEEEVWGLGFSLCDSGFRV
jgi:hypothetical protein